MSERSFAIFLLILTLLYGTMALQIEVPFAYDPLGPKPVPLAIAGLSALLSIYIVVRPGGESAGTQPQLQRGLCLTALLFFYSATWLPLGFLLSTTISVYLLSRLFHCSWMQGLMTALVVSVLCYGLFNFLLHVPLPLGTLFSYGSG